MQRIFPQLKKSQFKLDDDGAAAAAAHNQEIIT